MGFLSFELKQKHKLSDIRVVEPGEHITHSRSCECLSLAFSYKRKTEFFTWTEQIKCCQVRLYISFYTGNISSLRFPIALCKNHFSSPGMAPYIDSLKNVPSPSVFPRLCDFSSVLTLLTLFFISKEVEGNAVVTQSPVRSTVVTTSDGGSSGLSAQEI